VINSYFHFEEGKMIRKGDYGRYRGVKTNLLLHGPMGSGKTSAVREIMGSDVKLEKVEMFGELVLVRQSESFIRVRVLVEVQKSHVDVIKYIWIYIL
jgi:septin family protein